MLSLLILELREPKGKSGSDRGSSWSQGTGSTDGYSFLDLLEEEGEGKRKREEMVRVEVRQRGLKVGQGWEERARKEREQEKWKIVEEDENGERKKVKVPTPENMDLGLDKRGPTLNNSNRKNHCFGVGRTPIFPNEKGEKGEGRNWTATFTRSGCVACRVEDGTVNHKGRGGEPLILVIRDDSIPSVVGHTRKGEEGGCAWVFKKEMLRLEEVPDILRKLDQEKKGWDLEGKRRPHEFFVPNGSKILVGSYAHLRRVGLEAYIEAFNTMVREVFRVTGDIGVEVLPVVPVHCPKNFRKSPCN
jgi:hypothetical protein